MALGTTVTVKRRLNEDRPPDTAEDKPPPLPPRLTYQSWIEAVNDYNHGRWVFLNGVIHSGNLPRRQASAAIRAVFLFALDSSPRVHVAALSGHGEYVILKYLSTLILPPKTIVFLEGF